MQDVGEHEQQGAGSDGGIGEQLGEKPLKKKRKASRATFFTEPTVPYLPSRGTPYDTLTAVCFVTCGTHNHKGGAEPWFC